MINQISFEITLNSKHRTDKKQKHNNLVFQKSG